MKARFTRSEVGKRSIQIVLPEVAKNRLVLATDLLVGAEDHEQEPGVPVCNLCGVPFGCDLLVAVASDGSADGGCCGQSTDHCEMDTRRKERVDEAPSVTDDA